MVEAGDASEPLVVVGLEGPRRGERFVARDGLDFGRSPSCAVALPDGQVSRHHARLTADGAGGLQLEDLGSRNGTRVDGEPLRAPVALRPGLQFALGESLFRVIAAAEGVLVPLEPSSVAAPLPRAGFRGWLVPDSPFELLTLAAARMAEAPSAEIRFRRVAELLFRALVAEGIALHPLAPGREPWGIGAPPRLPPLAGEAPLQSGELLVVGSRTVLALGAEGASPWALLVVTRQGRALQPHEQPLLAAVARWFESEPLERGGSELRPEAPRMVLEGRLWRRSVEQAQRLAEAGLSAVLVGEPGVGKRLLAEGWLARLPPGPQLVVDAADGGAERRLFGPAGLSRVDGGTVLLLHVDEASPALAERLSALFRTGRLARDVGPDLQLSVRWLLTSALPLAALGMRPGWEAAALGRLGATTVEVPPLRTRPESLRALWRHFEGTDDALWSPQLAALLEAYPWPGNVEELSHLAARSQRLAQPLSELAQLPPEFLTEADDRALGQRIATLEREAIERALAASRGKKVEAARRLGISRPTLDKKLRQYDIPIRRRAAAPKADDPEST